MLINFYFFFQFSFLGESDNWFLLEFDFNVWIFSWIREKFTVEGHTGWEVSTCHQIVYFLNRNFCLVFYLVNKWNPVYNEYFLSPIQTFLMKVFQPEMLLWSKFVWIKEISPFIEVSPKKIIIFLIYSRKSFSKSQWQIETSRFLWCPFRFFGIKNASIKISVKFSNSKEISKFSFQIFSNKLFSYSFFLIKEIEVYNWNKLTKKSQENNGDSLNRKGLG